MACCGNSCCGSGYDGSGGVLIGKASGAAVRYQDPPAALMNPVPQLHSSGGTQVRCQCCCVPECPPCGAGGYGDGRDMGTVVMITKAPSDVTWGGSYLMKQGGCGQVSSSCYDGCCGPC